MQAQKVAADRRERFSCRFEAPEYSEEGISEFKSTLEDADKISKMDFYGSFVGNALVGVLAMRQPRHISLFFMKEEYHRRGIGRSLFDAMRRDYEKQVFTVNSSPYAVEVYRHLGFIQTDTEQVTNGIRCIPMSYSEKNLYNG